MKLKLNLINLIDNFNETNLNKIKNDCYLLNIIDNIKNPSHANQKLGLSFFTILLIPVLVKNMFLQNSINFNINILDLFLTIVLSVLTYDHIKFRFIEYKINKSNNFKELYHLSVKIITQYIIHIEKTDLFFI